MMQSDSAAVNSDGMIMSAHLPKKRYWQVRELIVIGIFAALIKVSTLLIAIAGGGMNPVTLVLKNIVATSLLVVLLYKVRKFGVLTLFVMVSSVVSLLLMGGNMITVPGMLIAGLTCDCLIVVAGGYKRTWSLIAGIGLFDFLSRAITLGCSYLTFREEPKLFIMGVVVVTIGYLGCLLGLGSGVFFVKELKHAGIIRE
ncbi:MAG: MptD family putative ECF transporter S component [Dissulfuribacterales bacterium]